jgi:pSer/pThr/pTyr-binding forkhead associated (FHA) protein
MTTRLIIEVRFGPLQGTKAVIEPGASLRIGRDPDAGIAVLGDAQMSTLHCEIAWDGVRATLRDLNSLQGTWLGGQRVDHGEIAHGNWVRAGDTVFMVYVEEKTPPRMGADVELTPLKARALAALESEAQPLFAVLDSARSERILELMRESVEPYRSLYEGIQAESLAEVAPYLVSLPKGTRLLPRLVREGWGKRWGIYLTSPRSFKEVRTHLRRFLMVENEEAREPMYFRYYDPVSLRTFLTGCPVRHRFEFFGEINCFWAEERDGTATRYLLEVQAC